MVLIGNAKQATGEGKSGPVETGLTGLAATALPGLPTNINYVVWHLFKVIFIQTTIH